MCTLWQRQTFCSWCPSVRWMDYTSRRLRQVPLHVSRASHCSVAVDHDHPIMTTVWPPSFNGHSQQDNAPHHKATTVWSWDSTIWQWNLWTWVSSSVSRLESCRSKSSSGWSRTADWQPNVKLTDWQKWWAASCWHEAGSQRKEWLQPPSALHLLGVTVSSRWTRQGWPPLYPENLQLYIRAQQPHSHNTHTVFPVESWATVFAQLVDSTTGSWTDHHLQFLGNFRSRWLTKILIWFK